MMCCMARVTVVAYGSTKPPRLVLAGALLLRHRKTANAFGRARWRFFILSFFCSSGQPSIGAPLIFIIPCISVNGKFIGKKIGRVYFFIL